MLAGGSYYSYSNCPSTMPPPAGTNTACLNCQFCGSQSCFSNIQIKKPHKFRFHKKTTNQLPLNCVISDKFYLGKIDAGAGCGSNVMLEASYQLNNHKLIQNPLSTWSNHPAVLLAQSNYDSYANRDISKFYYQIMKNHAGSKNNVYRVSSNNPTTGHFYFAEMVIPTINMMLKYTHANDKACNIFSGKNCPPEAAPAPNTYALQQKNDRVSFIKGYVYSVNGKRMTSYITDAYGKYVACNDQELGLSWYSISKKFGCSLPRQIHLLPDTRNTTTIM